MVFCDISLVATAGAVNGIGAVCGQVPAARLVILLSLPLWLAPNALCAAIPQQGIVGERGNGAAQTVDTGGVGGDISGV